MIDIPGYSIELELGHGGMATVFLAVQESLNRLVALKVMTPALSADRNFSERFLREGRTLGHLSHPHILDVYDVGTYKHFQYIAMEYLPKGDLKSRIEQTIRLSSGDALNILQQIAEALGYAHQKGFVHRDVKPENILFKEDETALLSDFGIAKTIFSSTRITATGLSIGTPHYTSPEQARGKVVDGRADLYSLGVVFYEMLTGMVPYDAEDHMAIGIKHITEPLPTLPSEYGFLQVLIDKLMAKDPAERLQNAEELLQLITWVKNKKVGKELGASSTRVIPGVGVKENSKVYNKIAWGVGGAIVASVLTTGGYMYLKFPYSSMNSKITGGGITTVTDGHQSIPFKEKIIPIDNNEISTEKENNSLVSGLSSMREKVTPDIFTAYHPSLNVNDKSLVNESVNQRQKIDSLLHLSEIDFQALRLSSPSGENALEKLNAVLAIDPDNSPAKKGIKKIIKRYLEMADQALKMQQMDIATTYIDKAASIEPSNSRVIKAKKKLVHAKEASKAKRMHLALLNKPAKKSVSLENSKPRQALDLDIQRSEKKAKKEGTEKIIHAVVEKEPDSSNQSTSESKIIQQEFLKLYQEIEHDIKNDRYGIAYSKIKILNSFAYNNGDAEKIKILKRKLKEKVND